MPNKPKVAIITPGSFPIPSARSSSVETVVYKLANALNKDVEFTIFGKKAKELPFTEVKGNISYIRFTFRHWTSYLSKVAAKLAKLKPDIIQIENRPSFVPTVRKRFPNARILLSLHSTMFLSKAYIQKNELIHALSLADQIIVNSHFLKNYLIEKFNCDQDRIMVNHLGVDTSQFRSKWMTDKTSRKEDITKQRGLEGKNILLFVGRLRKIKGVHRLIKAMPKILELVPDTILFIAGSAYYGSARKTRYVEYLQELAKECGENIRFLSFIPHSEIHRWFEAADIVLVPSIGKEAFGLVNIEAMAAGVPVIAANVGGIPEIIEHGKTGYLIKPEHMEDELTMAVVDLLSNPTKLRKLGEMGAKRVHDYFTWDNAAKRLLDLYQEQAKK